MEKVPVSERAILMRLKRKLEREGLILKQCHPKSRWIRDLGELYTVDMNNCIDRTNLNLEMLIEEEGILKGYEEFSVAKVS